MQGMVFNIQRMSVHDGPGVRTTVFLKGCGLNCYWCHNPESISGKPQLMLYPQKCIGDGACMSVCPQNLRRPETGPFDFDRSGCVGCGACAEACYAGAAELVGKKYSSEQLAEEALRDQPFYQNGGGVTFSGGEPLLQADFVAETAARIREKNVSVVVDTAFFVPWSSVEKVLPWASLWIVDCKAVTAELHERGTGQPNERILENLRRLAESGVPYWVRTPLVPGFNDAAEELQKIGDFLRSLPKPPEKYEILPFHGLCSGKYAALGKEFPAKDVQPPTAERARWATQCVGM